MTDNLQDVSNTYIDQAESLDNQITMAQNINNENILIDSNNNLRILYITLVVIVGLLLLWIIIVIMTRQDPIKILGEMNNDIIQLPASSDIVTTDIQWDEQLVMDNDDSSPNANISQPRGAPTGQNEVLFGESSIILPI